MNPFRFKDASNNPHVAQDLQKVVNKMSDSESQASVRDLQVSLEKMTDDRDRWRSIAHRLAENARTSATKYYGRSMDYIMNDASTEEQG